MVLISANDIFIFQELFVEPKNTAISPNFLVWGSCGKAQFGHSFVRFVQNYAKTAPFHKTATP